MCVMAKSKIRLYFCYTHFEKEVIVEIKDVYTVVTWHTLVITRHISVTGNIFWCQINGYVNLDKNVFT